MKSSVSLLVPYTLSLLYITYVSASEEHVKSICSRCQCLDVNPFSVDCDTMDFKEMPKFKKDLKLPWRFHIQGNALTSIPSFPYLENLTSISFRYNKISSIDDKAFLNLTNLQSLDLGHNNITLESLNPEIFRGPFHQHLPDPIPLRELKLDNNHLKQLPKHVFKYLVNLTSLDLSHNMFLDLSLKTAEALADLQNLETLDLSYTSLRRLPNHFFAELGKLKHLDLSGNYFIVVPPEVNYAHSLVSLSFNDNVFGIVTTDSFWDTLKYVETLSLKESNSMFRIEDGAFGNLTSLKKLWLNNNPQLSIISPLAFTNRYNRTIHLEEVHLENNALQYLPETALPWKNVPYLNLQGNPWNCDCNFEWLARDVMPEMEKSNFDLTIHVLCAQPPELMGVRVTNDKVQNHKFVCTNYGLNVEKYGFVIVATIIVGTLLLVTGTIIFSYVLFRRAKIHEWVGDNVKYRRTMNEEEEIISSNMQY